MVNIKENTTGYIGQTTRNREEIKKRLKNVEILMEIKCVQQ